MSTEVICVVCKEGKIKTSSERITEDRNQRKYEEEEISFAKCGISLVGPKPFPDFITTGWKHTLYCENCGVQYHHLPKNKESK